MEAGGRTLLRAWAHLGVLWAFAVAQPVLQVLADSAAFHGGARQRLERRRPLAGERIRLGEVTVSGENGPVTVSFGEFIRLRNQAADRIVELNR